MSVWWNHLDVFPSYPALYLADVERVEHEVVVLTAWQLHPQSVLSVVIDIPFYFPYSVHVIIFLLRSVIIVTVL